MQSLLILIYCWNNLKINFVIDLLILIDWKNNSYDSTFVIIDWLYNVVAMWPCYVISFVIIFNNIPLNPPIALTYHFVPNSLPFQYTKPYSSICWKLTLFHHIAETLPAVILLSSHLLKNNLLWFDFVGNWIFSYSLTIVN